MAMEGTGARLRSLRLIRGWSIENCAEATGLAASAVEAVERGEAIGEHLEALARCHGLSVELLQEDRVGPAGAGEFSIFLLQGAYQDFESQDVPMFERTLGYARRLSAEVLPGESGLALRRSMLPSRPAGPAPKQAAVQGHRLARVVRERLGLGDQPVGDLRELCEDRLGVPVLVDEFVTELRAASVVDVGRSAAAIILSGQDPARERNPVLARVYLAHELAHVLFDPLAPGQVLLALDNSMDGRNQMSGSRLNGLYESRAKGFAAEFLLPRSGLVGELGEPVSVAGARDAAALVEHVQQRFSTPWELTVNHLVNHGFIARELREVLVSSPAFRRAVPADSTTLPAPGAPPRCLFGREAREHDPDLAWASRDAALRAAGNVANLWVQESQAHARAGRPRAAADSLCDRLDALLSADELDLAKKLLEAVDPDQTEPIVLTGLMTVLASVPEALSAPRRQFAAAAFQSLETTYAWTAERVQRMRARVG